MRTPRPNGSHRPYAYAWTNIPADCEFLLDYEDDNSKRKTPWRYRWPEEVHDEILARLLKLNQERHEEEVRGGNLSHRVVLVIPIRASR